MLYKHSLRNWIDIYRKRSEKKSCQRNIYNRRSYKEHYGKEFYVDIILPGCVINQRRIVRHARNAVVQLSVDSLYPRWYTNYTGCSIEIVCFFLKCFLISARSVSKTDLSSTGPRVKSGAHPLTTRTFTAVVLRVKNIF